MTRLSTLASLVEAARALPSRVCVSPHQRPDGDAVGAAVGMVELLRALGKDAFYLQLDAAPPRVAFLLGDVPARPLDQVLRGELLSGAIALVVVDTSNRSLIESLGELPVALAIDHHLSHEPYAARFFLDEKASSASQLVTELARACDVELSLFGASALYGGIMSDTNRFAWGNSGGDFARTLETAAWLVRRGIPAREISETLTRTVSRSYLSLMAFEISERLKYWQEGKIAVMVTSEAEIEKFGCNAEDKDMLLALFQAIEGVAMSVVVVETKAGRCRLSVRTQRDSLRADKLCAVFGGGGHACAAGTGAGVAMPLAEFLPRLKEAVEVHWKTYGQAS